MPAFLAGPAAWAFGLRILPKKTRNLQEKSQNSWPVDHAAEYCMVPGVQLDILYRNARAGHNENRLAMVPIRQNVLVVSAAAVVAAAVAAADAFAAAAVAREAVKPIAVVARKAVKPIAVVAREAVKPIADVAAQRAAKPIVVDDDVVDLCRHVCLERCHGLHDSVEPRRRALDRRLAALHLWSGHGPRRHLRSSSSSDRPESGLPPVHQGQCLSSIETSSRS